MRPPPVPSRAQGAPSPAPPALGTDVVRLSLRGSGHRQQRPRHLRELFLRMVAEERFGAERHGVRLGGHRGPAAGRCRPSRTVVRRPPVPKEQRMAGRVRLLDADPGTLAGEPDRCVDEAVVGSTRCHPAAAGCRGAAHWRGAARVHHPHHTVGVRVALTGVTGGGPTVTRVVPGPVRVQPEIAPRSARGRPRMPRLVQVGPGVPRARTDWTGADHARAGAEPARVGAEPARACSGRSWTGSDRVGTGRYGSVRRGVSVRLLRNKGGSRHNSPRVRPDGRHGCPGRRITGGPERAC